MAPIALAALPATKAVACGRAAMLAIEAALAHPRFAAGAFLPMRSRPGLGGQDLRPAQLQEAIGVDD